MGDDSGFFYRYRASVSYTTEDSVLSITGPERETREAAEADIAAAHGHVKSERGWVSESAQTVTEHIGVGRYEPCFAQ